MITREIESWYLAGLDAESSKYLGIKCYKDTNNITKEKFNENIPRKFQSRIDFMQEILKYFRIEVARQKNLSFNYFMKNTFEIIESINRK